jgi:UDP-hydrolysing UDP-N-acetyl-D-glucosamine 2-epimerase
LSGCPAIDLAKKARGGSAQKVFVKYGGVGPGIDSEQPYLVVLQHPVTTEYGQGFMQINETLAAVKALGMQAVWIWPNVDAGSDDISKGLRMFRERNRHLPIHFYRNFAPEDYICLIDNCACMVGNSSSGIREGSFLGVPAVDIGSRQNGRERGRNVIGVGYDRKEIEKEIRYQVEHGPYEPDYLYGDGNAGKRIADFLAKVEIRIQKQFFNG